MYIEIQSIDPVFGNVEMIQQTDCDLKVTKCSLETRDTKDLNHPTNPFSMIFLHFGLKSVYESLVVTDYLEDAYPEHRLYPDDALLKAKQRMLIEHSSKVCIQQYLCGI